MAFLLISYVSLSKLLDGLNSVFKFTSSLTDFNSNRLTNYSSVVILFTTWFYIRKK